MYLRRPGMFGAGGGVWHFALSQRWHLYSSEWPVSLQVRIHKDVLGQIHRIGITDFDGIAESRHKHGIYNIMWNVINFG